MMADEKKFVPVMITPFDQKLKIDLSGLSRLIDFYLAAGVKGFFANCLSSEMFSITEDERIELVKFIVDYVKGAVPVVATGSFGFSIKDKSESIRKIYDARVNAVILITSHFAGAEDSDDILLQNFENIFKLTDKIPLGLYECPAPYKRIISPEIFKILLNTDRLIYHKDTSINPEKVKAKLETLKEIKNNKLEFYDAHSPNAMSSLQLGAKGMSCISGNFYPEIMVWMCNNATDPEKRHDVKWLQSEISRVDPVIHQAYPISAKYFLKKRGLPVHLISRTYIQELTSEQKKNLDIVYSDFLGWCERLKIKLAI
ncbi:MAG TPA: dihydrodipicolinate synthase family protein [Puia sp.]|jgi:4-hydroxy-tetrahydrodipicolinate synthase|nr:dihydrodipicolinate synthase family protein [Puia sp.]